MIVIRPIASQDFEGYKKLALASHINFYTLPKVEDQLKALFELAVESFTSSSPYPDKQFYLFVAEDTTTNKLLGVSAISATSGRDDPLFFFRRQWLQVTSPLPHVVKSQELLTAVSYKEGPSEVCSLFVDPAARGTGVGKLLSLSRFLFAACFPERFTDVFIAELRGFLHNDSSMFWEAVGRHFYDVPFLEVQQMLSRGREFIGHFLPTYPIYIDLLPWSVQDMIGKVDSETLPAFSLLTRIGFEVTNEVDVIDGGPKLEAKRDAIRPISHSKRVKIVNFETLQPSDKHCILANEQLDFRAALSPCLFESESEVTISSDAAAKLQVNRGDEIRLFDLRSVPK